MRKERDKQRQQLDQLQHENDSLLKQKEQRLERHNLSLQLNDIEKRVRKHYRTLDKAREELESSKTRRHQLKRTLELLQGVVQSILAKSHYYDMNDKKSSEGKERAKQRQETLKKLLSDEVRNRLLTPSVSNLQYNHEDPNSPKNVNIRRKVSTALTSLDEDDEIHDDVVDAPTVSIFASGGKNNKRLESISSCDDEDDDNSRRIYRVPSMASKGNNSESNRRSPSRSRSRSRSKSRSGRKSKRKDNSSERGDNNTTSGRSRGKSQSSRRGRRNKRGQDQDDNDNNNDFDDDDFDNDDDNDNINEGNKKFHIYASNNGSSKERSGLANLLESHDSSDDGSDDDESDDTPKTNNTNGTNEMR